MKILKWNIITDKVLDEYVTNEVEHYTKAYKEQAEHYKTKCEELENQLDFIGEQNRYIDKLEKVIRRGKK